MKHHKGSTKDRSARTGRVERTDTRHEDAEYWQSRAERTSTPDKSSSRSDQDRVSDALEDDEVREVLGINRRRSPST